MVFAAVLLLVFSWSRSWGFESPARTKEETQHMDIKLNESTNAVLSGEHRVNLEKIQRLREDRND